MARSGYVNGVLRHDLPDLPTPPIEQLRVGVRQAINYWRDQEENSGFTALGHNWDSTPQSREKLLAVIVSGTNPLGIWTSADDVDVPVTLADLQALYTAMLTKGAQIHARQREMKAAIETMTVAQLQAFVPGWM